MYRLLCKIISKIIGKKLAKRYLIYYICTIKVPVSAGLDICTIKKMEGVLERGLLIFCTNFDPFLCTVNYEEMPQASLGVASSFYLKKHSFWLYCQISPVEKFGFFAGSGYFCIQNLKYRDYETNHPVTAPCGRVADNIFGRGARHRRTIQRTIRGCTRGNV